MTDTNPGPTARKKRLWPKLLAGTGSDNVHLLIVDTGGRVVRRCVFTDDVYRRTPGDAFGDLYVEWERSTPIERVWSPATGTVASTYEHWRQGDHERAISRILKPPDKRD